jgi:hypothetical protein
MASVEVLLTLPATAAGASAVAAAVKPAYVNVAVHERYSNILLTAVEVADGKPAATPGKGTKRAESEVRVGAQVSCGGTDARLLLIM